MPFRTYRTLGEVLKKYQIMYQEDSFVIPENRSVAPDRLKEEIAFTRREIPYDISEAAICENIIYPVLREVWKQFAGTLTIWSHQPIELNEELSGIPDYIFAKKSVLGKIVFDAPYVAVVEAKRDDFTGGWAQCALEMYTMQQLNQDTRLVFGVVSNGDTWEIGSLEAKTFYLYRERFDINALDDLFSALTHVLDSCKRIYNL